MKKSRKANDIVISGKANIILKNGRRAKVGFDFSDNDGGGVPHYGRLTGNNDVLYQAWLDRRVTLRFLDTRLQVDILGRDPFDGSVLVASAPFLRAFAV